MKPIVAFAVMHGILAGAWGAGKLGVYRSSRADAFSDATHDIERMSLLDTVDHDRRRMKAV